MKHLILFSILALCACGQSNSGSAKIAYAPDGEELNLNPGGNGISSSINLTSTASLRSY